MPQVLGGILRSLIWPRGILPVVPSFIRSVFRQKKRRLKPAKKRVKLELGIA